MESHTRIIKDYIRDPDFPLVVRKESDQDVMEMHRHKFQELVIVSSGSGLHKTENRDFELTRGDVFVIQEQEAHCYAAANKLELYNILFEPENLPLLYYDLADIPGYHSLFTIAPSLKKQGADTGPIVLSEGDMKTCIELITRLQKELASNTPGWKIASITAFYSLLIHLCRSVDVENIDRYFPIKSINKVIRYMEINFSKQILLKDLTDIAYMSESSLHRAFKQAFGISPMQKLTKIRLRKSAEYLKNTNLPISQIALDCGFYDSSHFCRTFQLWHKESPEKFRKACIKQATESAGS